MNHSIWIIPPQPIYTTLSKVINDLSAEYKGPLFSPHMTLLGNSDCELEDIKKTAEKIAKHTKKLTLTMGSISFSNTYYQSVLVRINPTAELMQLNLDLKEELGIENKLYMPHISLMYGNHDMKTREEIAKKIILPRTSFEVGEIVIIPEKPTPAEWTPVATIPLVGNQ